jgi:hypothetical protein
MLFVQNFKNKQHLAFTRIRPFELFYLKSKSEHVMPEITFCGIYKTIIRNMG